MKPTIQQTTLDTITISHNNQSIDIPFDDALFVASELNKVWQTDYDSLPFSLGVNEMTDLMSITNLFTGKIRVLTGTRSKMTTYCPKCFCVVEVRNAHAMQFVKDGILCDECRRKNLSDEVKSCTL